MSVVHIDTDVNKVLMKHPFILYNKQYERVWMCTHLLCCFCSTLLYEHYFFWVKRELQVSEHKLCEFVVPSDMVIFPKTPLIQSDKIKPLLFVHKAVFMHSVVYKTKYML